MARKTKQVDEGLTGRKQMEAALRESEERFRRLYERAPLGYQSLDVEGRFMDVNQAWLNLLGYTRDEVIGRWFGEFLTPHEVEAFRQRFPHFIATGEVHTDVEMVQRAGSTILVHIDGRIGYDEHGQFRQTHCILSDITELRRAEEELSQSEANYRSLFENSVMGISQALPDGRLICANAAYAHMYGYDNPEEMMAEVFHVGQHLYENPKDWEEVLRILEEQGVMEPREMAVVRRDGTRFFVLVGARKVRDSEGNLYCYQAEHIDITERKQAEAALCETVEKYHDLFHNAMVGMFRSRSDNDAFLNVNTKLCEIYDCSEEELLGNPASIHWADPAAYERMLDELRQRGSLYGYEFDICTKSGEIRTLSGSFRLYPEENYFNGSAIDITERKRADEALQASEEKFRGVVEHSVDGIVIADEQGTIIEWNQGQERITGLKRSDMLGKPVWKTLFQVTPEEKQFPEILEAYEKKTLDFLRSGKADWMNQLQESEIQRSDGTRLYVQAMMSPINTAKGWMTVSIMRDITERKRVEEALARSEADFRALAENALVGIVRVKLSGEILYANQALARILGFDSPADFMRRDIPSNFKKPAELEFLTQRLLLETRLSNYEVDVLTKAGDVRSVLFSATLIEEIISATVIDITGRKQAEEALRENEEKFKQLFEDSPSGIALVDTKGVMREANSNLLKLLNISKEDLVGKYFAELIPGSGLDIEEQLANFRIRLAGGTPIKELTFRKQDGKQTTIDVKSSVVMKDGQVTGIMFLVGDITERKRVEEALRESREHLAHLSRRLVQSQEQERRRIARELHDEVGQTLTALTISLGSISQIAADGVIRDKIADLQGLAHNLINQVNALSVDLRPRVLDDLGLIPGLISLVSRFSAQTGIEIDFKHMGLERIRVAPEIEISAYRIVQETLTNVVRHAGVKTASVCLQVEGESLWIQVQDEGKGFELQTALNTDGAMGLLNMTERATLVGGQLDIDTAPGEGTIITCRLPLGGNESAKEG